jgi:hypothetical protein
MDILVLAMLTATGVWLLRSDWQRGRIALLGSYLGKYQIEKLMESLNEGYLRALGESDPQRREQIWHLLGSTEEKLSKQFASFAADFSKVDAAQARVSTLPMAIPYADKLFPAATFDLRRVLAVHAEGITRAASANPDQTAKGRAFTLSAELFLMQHSCHWFCKSKNVASARLLVRHKTPYAQLLESVAPETARAYGSVVGIPSR